MECLGAVLEDLGEDADQDRQAEHMRVMTHQIWGHDGAAHFHPSIHPRGLRMSGTGENHGAETLSVAAIIPAVDDAAGM